MTIRLATAALVAAALITTPALAQEKRVNVGVLTCKEGTNVGFIVGSTTKLTCEFKPAGGGKVEHYAGEISQFGVDIGETKATQIVWGVFAPSTGGLAPDALTGEYGGLTAEATVTVGLGANVLIGGFSRSIALQPLSTQVQEGFNIAAGIAALKLKPAA